MSPGRPQDERHERDAGFRVVEPAGATSPVIVEVPHAGLRVDAPALASLAAPASCLATDADLYVDELYRDAPSVGAAMLVGEMSRYVVDLNRGPRDVDAGSVVGGPRPMRAPRGLVWRLTSDGQPALHAPLSQDELSRRVDRYYAPYHAALTRLIDDRVERFGYAVVLAGHSMPSVGRKAHPDTATHRADVVPGTRGRTSAAAPFIDAVDAAARAAGLSVAHDDPYQGGFTTSHYGRPFAHVHVVQIELARRLYMDERALTPNESFERTRASCIAFVEALVRARPPRG